MRKLALLLIVSAISFAQLKSDLNKSTVSDMFKQDSKSFIDLNKLSVSHSLSMSCYSFGGKAFFNNEYVAKIGYRLSEPLLLSAEIGASYVPMQSRMLPNQNGGSMYLKSISLDYKPSKSFNIFINYENKNSLDFYNDNSIFNNFGEKK